MILTNDLVLEIEQGEVQSGPYVLKAQWSSTSNAEPNKPQGF